MKNKKGKIMKTVYAVVEKDCCVTSSVNEGGDYETEDLVVKKAVFSSLKKAEAEAKKYNDLDKEDGLVKEGNERWDVRQIQVR